MRATRVVLLILLALGLSNGLAAAPRDAVELLLDSAAQHVAAGEFERAAADLERALRIEPRNAAIWHDLGQVRMHQGRYREAIVLAERSDDLAGHDSGLRDRNAHLVLAARRLSGENPPLDAATVSQFPPPVAFPRTIDTNPLPHRVDSETALASGAFSPTASFIDLALAVLPALLGDEIFADHPDPHAPLPPPAWGTAQPYQAPLPPRSDHPGDLHFELAPGLSVAVRLPEPRLPSDPLAASLLNAVVGAVESDRRRRSADVRHARGLPVMASTPEWTEQRKGQGRGRLDRPRRR